MLYYDGSSVSEGIDINKTCASEEYDICHYWYFLDNGFNIQPDVLNGYHDVLMISMNLCNIAILSIHCADYHCSINRISKS